MVNLPLSKIPDSLPQHPDYRIVAIAASAGGLRAFSLLLENLPPDFPVPIVAVQHLDPNHRSMLAEILNRRTALSVCQGQQNQPIQPGVVYFAPPDQHMLITSEAIISLTQSRLVHFVRPSADLLFESVAASYQEHAIAVVLTGTGKDGEMGVQAIKKMEGLVIVQDEQTSDFFGMPQAALDTGCVDYVLALDKIADALIQFTRGSAHDSRPEHQ